MKRKDSPSHMSDNDRVIHVANELIEAYQDRIRSAPGGYRGYTVRDCDHVQFIRVALRFETDDTFDAGVYITAAFGTEWLVKGKPLQRPLPFHLNNNCLMDRYRCLHNGGLREGTKVARIEKAVRDSVTVLQRLTGRNETIRDLSSTHVLETLRNGFISVYFVALCPHLERPMNRRLIEGVLDADPLTSDTWGALLEEVGEARQAMIELGITGAMRKILKAEGVLDG